MSSLKIILEVFDQNEYDHTFYCCQKDHAFVAFTTCYCPVCEVNVELEDLREELEGTDTKLDTCMENYEDLVVKVTNISPELLI